MLHATLGNTLTVGRGGRYERPRFTATSGPNLARLL
jgi:hypothetical protein